jgi:hypothetical protein
MKFRLAGLPKLQVKGCGRASRVSRELYAEITENR